MSSSVGIVYSLLKNVCIVYGGGQKPSGLRHCFGEKVNKKCSGLPSLPPKPGES